LNVPNQREKQAIGDVFWQAETLVYGLFFALVIRVTDHDATCCNIN